MKKQKICIIGGGLTGLLSSIALSKCNLDIHLFANSFHKKVKNYRTTALSHNSLEFLKKNNIINNFSRIWSVNEMEIYEFLKNNKFNKILDFKPDSDSKKLLYLISNYNFIDQMKKIIKISKNIKIKSNFGKKKNSYQLIINCTGAESDITDDISKKNFFNFGYSGKSFLTFVSHKKIKNYIARQFFLPEGPLALLPISNTRTSVVWTIKSKHLLESVTKNQAELKKKLRKILSSCLKLKSISKFESVNINPKVNRNYFNKRYLNFGDALHTIHPFAGQGFNMIIRDVIILKTILEKKISLGLDVGDTSVLKEFSDDTKSMNFLYSSGIEILNKIFSIDQTQFKNIRTFALKEINKNNVIKNVFSRFADKGLI